MVSVDGKDSAIPFQVLSALRDTERLKRKGKMNGGRDTKAIKVEDNNSTTTDYMMVPIPHSVDPEKKAVVHDLLHLKAEELLKLPTTVLRKKYELKRMCKGNTN